MRTDERSAEWVRTYCLPVVPPPVVHPLPQQLDGGLGPEHLQSRHVEVVDEHDKLLTQWGAKYSLASDRGEGGWEGGSEGEREGGGEKENKMTYIHLQDEQV